MILHGPFNNIHQLYDNWQKEFERLKWGYETLALFAQSCLGGIAAMLILANDTTGAVKLGELFLVTIFAMGFNAAVLVDLRAKPAFAILVCSVLVSLSMILINAF
jgi:hypothetical protein